MFRKLVIWFIFQCASTAALASYHPTRGSYGAIANNLMEPISGIMYFLKVAAILSGVGMLMGALFKFQSWRKNPVAVTIGVPVVMTLAALGLICVGLLTFAGLSY